MFNFVNLDDVDEGATAAEWQKWSGTPEWQRVPEQSEVKLMDQWEEVRAGGDDLKLKKIDVTLPKDAWDPLGLGAPVDSEQETKDLVQIHGDVGMNLSASVTSMREEYEKAQRRELARAQYEDRLLALERIDQRKQTHKLQKSATFSWEGSKKFEWRQIQNQLLPQPLYPQPYGGNAGEISLSKANFERSGYIKVGQFFVLPPATHFSVLAGAIGQVAPEPAGGRRGKADNWHIDFDQVIVPEAFVVEDGEDMIEGAKKSKGDMSWAPNRTHMVIHLCSKQPGLKEPRPHWGKVEYGK